MPRYIFICVSWSLLPSEYGLCVCGVLFNNCLLNWPAFRSFHDRYGWWNLVAKIRKVNNILIQLCILSVCTQKDLKNSSCREVDVNRLVVCNVSNRNFHWSNTVNVNVFSGDEILKKVKAAYYYWMEVNFLVLKSPTACTSSFSKNALFRFPKYLTFSIRCV